VTQQRHAVEVREPAALASFLELLIGSSGLQEELRGLEAEEAEATGRYDATEDAVET
jgi:hypothetical protein